MPLRFSPNIAVFLIACLGAVVPAQALDVDFDGTVLAVCSLALSTDGTLTLSANGTVLGSEEPLGVPAAVTILSIGSNSVDVAAPSRISADPAGYDNSLETIEVSYTGVAGLAAVSQTYTSSPTSFALGSIPLSVLTVNNRINNSNGFAAGTYTTRTVVTCS